MDHAGPAESSCDDNAVEYRGVRALSWVVSCLLVAGSCAADMPWAPASLAERTQSSLDAVGADVEDALVTQAGGGWIRRTQARYTTCRTEDGTTGQRYDIGERGLPSALAQDWDVTVAVARSAANAHGYTRESMSTMSGTRRHVFADDDGNTVEIQLHQQSGSFSLSAVSECRTQW